MSWLVVVTLVASSACGHKPPPPPVEPDHGGDTATPPPPDTSASMISADKMDEINRDLSRKRETVSRCLAPVVDAHELPRNAKGKITFEIVIASGHARDVTVVNASLDNKSLTDCAIGKVKEIEFPQLDQPYETSFTYEFEAI
nr:AgmX/PglI C-terminal domain-containing protein [Kofleriaceae bacterium]